MVHILVVQEQAVKVMLVVMLALITLLVAAEALGRLVETLAQIQVTVAQEQLLQLQAVA